MASYLKSAPAEWVPELFAARVDLAIGRQSVAHQIGTILRVSDTTVKIPTVTSDPTAAFGAEGSELNESDPGLDGISVTPKRLGLVSKVSREFFDDETQIRETVTDGQARDIARQIDRALFATTAATVDDPAGLGQATGITDISAGAAWTNVDPFSEAAENAAGHGTTIGSWVASPATAKSLGTLKTATDSNLPLLGSDPTLPGRRQILGSPLYTSDYVPDGVVWGIPREHLVIVHRGGVESEVDESTYFTSYAVALRSVVRVGFAITYPAAFQRISLTGAFGWTVTIGGSPSGGTFTLTYGGNTTSAIAYNATSATVKTALAGLDDGYAAADWTVTGDAGGPYTVTAPAGGAITADGDKLTGGTNPSVTVAAA